MKIQKVAENAANFYRALTSPIRLMPDFLIIGAKPMEADRLLLAVKAANGTQPIGWVSYQRSTFQP